MKNTKWAFAATAAMTLSACGSLGIGDQFSYSTKEDGFTGEKISIAEAAVDGDTDKAVALKLSLTCRYNAKGKPDPWQNTLLTIAVTGSDGSQPQFADLSLKFDDAQPGDFDAVKKVSKTASADGIEMFYVLGTVLALPPEDRIPAFTLVTMGSDDLGITKMIAGMANMLSGGSTAKPKTDDQLRTMLAQAAMDAKKLAVRYSVSGQPNTAEFDISSRNFRKVLSDCGWDQLGATPANSKKEDHAPETQPARSSPADGPPQAITNNPTVKARLAQISAPIAWTKDQNTQGLKDCWTASESLADHSNVIDRYCLGMADNAVHVYDAAEDSWTPVSSPPQASGPAAARGNFYNIYGSFPVGEQASSQTDRVLSKLRQCGIQASSDYTYNYRGLAPNLMVVLSGPYPSAQSASSELNRAKACSIPGYTKTADFIGGE